MANGKKLGLMRRDRVKLPRLRMNVLWHLLLHLLLLLIVSLAGCGQEPSAKRAFYYWRTTFSLSSAEKELLARHRVEKLYLRLFDVGWDSAAGQARPMARCAFEQAIPAGVEVVPVVFLTNAVFEHQAHPEELASRVWELVRLTASGAGFSFAELQVDCDWSEGTRQAFFAFCQSLRARLASEKLRLSATIRLHQVKYAARTGVPPVDRGMLMFYNLAPISADAPRPSIFNTFDAARYASFVDRYPLPLDAALPIFSWAIHARGTQVLGLMQKPDEAALGKSPALRMLAPGHFEALRPTIFQGTYLQAKDSLRLETVGPELARQAAELLAKHFHPRGGFTLTLFDLDERNTQNYEPHDLDALYSAVR